MIKDHISESYYRLLTNKARKSWVQIVDKSIFDSYSKEQKFEKYKEIDYKVLKRYHHLVQGRKHKDLKSKDLEKIMLEAAADVLKGYYND